MSIVVAAASRASATIVTDSLHVDLRTGAASTGAVKHVRVGGRVAALAGISDVDGVSFLPWLAQACAAASTLDRLADEFLTAGGADLVAAFRQWRSLVGPDEPAESFLSIVAASTESGTGELVRLWTADAFGALTLAGDQYVAESRAVVESVGAVDAELVAQTESGRVVRRAQQLQRVPVTVPQAADLPGGWGPEQLTAWTVRQVEAALDRQQGLPRPVWWPAGAPVAAGPLHVA